MIGIIVGLAVVVLLCGLMNSIKPALLVIGAGLLLTGINLIQTPGLSVFSLVVSLGCMIVGIILLIALFK